VKGTSSHLGNEFLLQPQKPESRVSRINSSFEALERFGAREWKGLQFTGSARIPPYVEVPPNMEAKRIIPILSAVPVR